MGLIAKPHNFVALATKSGEAAQVNADFDTIYAEFNGQINDANIVALANIQQSKILNLVSDLATINTKLITEINVVTFTSNGTYTKPSDLVYARIITQAGGGGGGGVPASGGGTTRCAGGGGGGGYGEKWLMAAAIGATESVLIGAGGVAGAAGGVGGTGGDTSFGSLVSALGGTGGNFATLDHTPANGNAGGGSLNASIIMIGNPGGHGWAQGGQAIGGHGGGSHLGGGGVGAIAPAVGGNGSNYGGGGGGGASGPSAIATGGVGGPGICIVVEYKA